MRSAGSDDRVRPCSVGRHEQAKILDSLGYIYLRRDDRDLVVRFCERSRRLDDRHGAPDALDRLGDVHRAAGERDADRRRWQRAMPIAETVDPAEGDRVGAKLGPAEVVRSRARPGT
jgi:hypothetical protein